NESARPGAYSLSLHDALPIWAGLDLARALAAYCRSRRNASRDGPGAESRLRVLAGGVRRCGQLRGKQPRGRVDSGRTAPASSSRSEEHTSELQSRENLVCRLL